MAKKSKTKAKHIGFGKLSGKVSREYEAKGVSPKTARYYGNATAGKIANAKRKKRSR